MGIQVPKKFPVIAKTSFGFEELLMQELKDLGATQIRKGTRAVYFEADQKLLYRANLFSRVALRFLKPVAEFAAGSEQALYEGIKVTDWSRFMSADDTLAIDAVVSRSTLTHSLYVAQKAKDGIVDQFRNRTGKRPNVDTRHPALRIHVHIHEDKASVSLDSSGSSLHRRGYRQQTGEAPLNETLAAGMLLLSGWDAKSPLTDLMCGSGTILIEAALMARRIAPGLFRQEFGFEHWQDFDPDLWESVRQEALDLRLPGLDYRITGTDRAAQVLHFARENARAAGVDRDIDFYHMSFEDYTPDQLPATVICNPPYGGRLTDEDLFSLYKNLGDTFKKKFSGSKAWVLTANKEAAKYIGLHPSRKIPMFNGPLECRFMGFELYSGTRKHKKETLDEDRPS